MSTGEIDVHERNIIKAHFICLSLLHIVQQSRIRTHFHDDDVAAHSQIIWWQWRHLVWHKIFDGLNFTTRFWHFFLSVNTEERLEINASFLQPGYVRKTLRTCVILTTIIPLTVDNIPRSTLPPPTHFFYIELWAVLYRTMSRNKSRKHASFYSKCKRLL